MVQKTVRLPGFLVERLAKEMRPRGYTSLSAFIRIALQNELDGREAEQRTASTMDRLARELRRLDTTHQAEFAFLDVLARVILHCRSHRSRSGTRRWPKRRNGIRKF